MGIHPATLQRCETQSVSGGVPTQSVGTINLTITKFINAEIRGQANFKRIILIFTSVSYVDSTAF